MSLLERLVGRPLVRRLTDAVMGRYARHRVRQLDGRPAARQQRQTLFRLLRQARNTAFGRDHGFERIDSVAEYQRRVPLRDYEAFWSQYWRGPFPVLRDVTWPGLVPYFALSSGTTSGATKHIPVTRPMLASNQRAALTTLALFLSSAPGTPLFTGRLLFLGGSTDLTELGTRNAECGTGAVPDSVRAGDLSGITTVEASALLRPFTYPPPEVALLRDWDEKMRRLARDAVRLPITMLSGVPSWLLVLFDHLRRVSGRDAIADIWPGLRLVIHGGTRFDPYRPLFRRLLGPAVRLLETYPASEGFIATEDPRHDLLRLIPDHNLFFEFVPVGELDRDRPTRHTVAEIEPGVQYAVILTTCAGLWGYVLGDTVCFERREPPLLRFTGRTRYFLSAFGEHLISEEVERAVARAAETLGTAVVDFHVGPVFPETPMTPGRHRYLIEFAGQAPDPAHFASELDAVLCRVNEDYQAHRQGDLTMRLPEVVPVRPGGFADWMRSQGKLGGQHKVPRMDNSGELTARLSAFLRCGPRSSGKEGAV
jgi:hypothetical protein